MSKTILVDDISSIGDGYFTFKAKGKVIKEAPFRCKLKTEQGKDSSYHLDETDLQTLNERYRNIYDRKEFALSKKEYISTMKI